MHNPAALLLRSLHTATILNNREELNANEVNDLGESLGLSSETVLRMVEQLKAEKLVELYWGGKLSLTATGRGRATGEPAAGIGGGISLGSGAIYAPGNTGQIGHGTGAIGSTVAVGGIALGQTLTAAAGDLAALLQALRPIESSPDQTVAAAAREIGQEARSAFDVIRQPGADPSRVKQHAERLRSLLANLGDVAVWGERGYAIIELGRTVAEHLGKLLPP